MELKRTALGHKRMGSNPDILRIQIACERDIPSGLSNAARITRRPMRPKPLIPILVGMFVLVRSSD